MADSSLPPAGSHRLLVAEDEPHIRRILITNLEAYGLRMDVVEDGGAAMEAVRGDGHYDLIVLDVVMPVHSGLEVLRELRSLPWRAVTPVIVLTAKGQDADREEAYALGANAFLTKPFSPKKFLSHVDELLDRP
jgi:CheY-like chemotaxis protein